MVIVGGGITGLFTAKQLVEAGVEGITILERNYVGSGGTFRCATGIRASFTSREHVAIMRRAIELWPKWAEDLGFQYRRDGYLWLLTREQDVELFRRAVEFQRSMGLGTRMIGPDEVIEIVPHINVEGVLAAVHDPLAGKAQVFNAVFGALARLRARGVEVLDHTEARALIPDGRRIRGVLTNRGLFEAEHVIVAAGSGSRDLLTTAGISLPIRNVPKHALVTEAFRPAIRPLVIDWATSSYIVQLIHGNFYIGADIPEEPDSPALNKFEFLRKAARVWAKYFPWLREVYVLRYWTGYYDVTPDHHPAIGPVEEFENLYVAAGFSGHGFMMAPAVAEALADHVLGRRPAVPEFESLLPGRLARGQLVKEVAVFG